MIYCGCSGADGKACNEFQHTASDLQSHDQKVPWLDLHPIHPEPIEHIAHHTDLAASAERKIDRIFWVDATARAILRAAPDDADERNQLLRYACTRIQLSTALTLKQRSAILRSLCRRILPIT